MTWNLTALTLLFSLLTLLTGLTITVIMDPYIGRRHRGVMLIIIVLSLSLIAQNLLEDYLASGTPRWFLRTAASVYGYSIRPIFLLLFLYIVQPERTHRVWWGLVILNCAVHMTAFFSHLCFWISKDNHYHGGPLSRTCLIVGMILLVNLMLQCLRDYHTLRKRDLLIPGLAVLVILGSVFVDMQKVELEGQPITFLTCGIITDSVLYYIWLHLRFVRDHEDDLKARQQIQLMLSQIQPHFLYNTLGAIEELCDSAPKAKNAIHIFSQYLRGNMDTLSEAEMIPFTRELNHTKLFLELEKLRFGEDLTIVYDITCTDFSIPTLTLQPIVENAVSHGVRMTEWGQGTVTITTKEFDDRFEVTVLDDGPGFDPEKIPDDGRSHVGISNVRKRLQSSCGGRLRIESGNGACVSIILPKDGQIHANLCN